MLTWRNLIINAEMNRIIRLVTMRTYLIQHNKEAAAISLFVTLALTAYSSSFLFH